MVNELSTHKKKSLIADYIWYWASIGISIFSLILILIINNADNPLVYIRHILTTLLVTFLPGFGIVKIFFPKKFSYNFSNYNKKENICVYLDFFEKIALSMSLSIILVIIMCLILNYTPWGLGLISLTLNLIIITLLFTTIGFIRQYKADNL